LTLKTVINLILYATLIAITAAKNGNSITITEGKRLVIAYLYKVS